MPDVIGTGLSRSQFPDALRAKLDCPAPDSPVRHVDVVFRQCFFSLAQTQIEAGAQPQSMSDDLGRQAVTFITDGDICIQTVMRAIELHFVSQPHARA